VTEREIPVVEPPFDGERSSVTVAGVLLAAGTSSRFGDENKLLATVAGEPIVRRALEPLLAADLAAVFVVVGHEADAVRSAVSDPPVTVVRNDEYEAGQATSVRRGVEAVTGHAGESTEGGERGEPVDGVLFALGDMPDVRAETVGTLVDAFAADAGDPLVAACDGRRGNPVLFGARFFDRLARVEGDTGGREILLSADRTRLVETGDPGVRRDVDRPEDL
jgi:molybdenum cofactor cytidylyltransferase